MFRQRHERFDGSGYPHRLAGDSIPLSARIVAVADVYDALTSKRVYKGAFTHQITRSMIVGQAGAQFDPDVVDAFVHNEAQFLAIRSQFTDAQALAA
jgi:response regulator RpfG family c-di-GMP phosphodiesterase